MGLSADRVLSESGTLGEAFERLADQDDTYCLIIDSEPVEWDDQRDWSTRRPAEADNAAKDYDIGTLDKERRAAIQAMTEAWEVVAERDDRIARAADRIAELEAAAVEWRPAWRAADGSIWTDDYPREPDADVVTGMVAFAPEGSEDAED